VTLSPDDATFAPLTTGIVTTATGPAAKVPSQAFAPGVILAGRYRLVALLGRGGMGEVYRADDLTLDQPIALKFLPDGVIAGDVRLNRFHNELRTARQVSHRNVCRVYDLGEAYGRQFLTMEYVDGEDLASLLRRIGRVPQDKAVEIARQLCAGVAAAHDRGVIHRDLKPANVMIDGEGNVRITDFGIATAMGTAEEGFVGTPQYMAPEQIAGRPASIRSDIYSLGLVLFELFTGRRAVDSKTVAELKEFHSSGTITTPSSIVRELDPAVERTILRCLERDPEQRPASALVVAAALPGSDPLAAALAAGETPSPELVAAAGEAEVLGVTPGLAMVTVTLIGLLTFAIWSPRTSIAGRTPLDLAPAVLIDRAHQTIESLGYSRMSGDHAHGFVRANDYTRWLFETRETPQRYDPVTSGNPPAVLFWYRSSPRSLEPQATSRVTQFDPPPIDTDMRTVVLDGRGRLQEFRSVPPQFDPPVDSPPAPSWDLAFTAAGLDQASFLPVAPQWSPRDYADTRAAWEGPLPGDPATQIRVEAGAYKGKLVSLKIAGPWTTSAVTNRRSSDMADRIVLGMVTIVVCGLFALGVVMARRNLRANRADRRGAARLAWCLAAIGFTSWLLSAHHQAELTAESDILSRAAAGVMLMTALLWTVYIALEPYVRKLWPDSLLGWSRLLAGHVRDPRVGRDVLIGATAGVCVALIEVAKASVIPWLGYSAPSPTFGSEVDLLSGAGRFVSQWPRTAGVAIESALLLVLLIVLVKLTLRRMWLVLAVAIVILGTPTMGQAGTADTSLVFLFGLTNGLIFTWVVFRGGLLPFAVAWFVWRMLVDVPIVQDVSHWSAAAGNWTLAVVAALTCFGFYAARSGQPLFGTVLRE
jgi:hypothetical protein